MGRGEQRRGVVAWGGYVLPSTTVAISTRYKVNGLNERIFCFSKIELCP